jgi:lysophospholipase L1-like esterase
MPHSSQDPAFQAIALGREQAAAVVAFRDNALQGRQQAFITRAQKASFAATESAAAAIAPGLLQALGSSVNTGVLVAEGDSWFDYPWTDVVQLLEDTHGFDVHSVARKGDRVEEMAYTGGQLETFTRKIEKLLRDGKVPKAILLSGGGNDIAGDEFATLLNHANSPTPGLNTDIVAGFLDQRIRLAYVTILSAVTRLCEVRLGRKVPILLHGYDYPVPDGRGFLGGWGWLPGPWLAPGFQNKGYAHLSDRKRIIQELMDRFNTMLAGIAGLSDFDHITYIDLRGTLSTSTNYKDWWDNELHPTVKGFELVADRFAAVISQL